MLESGREHSRDFVQLVQACPAGRMLGADILGWWQSIDFCRWKVLEALHDGQRRAEQEGLHILRRRERHTLDLLVVHPGEVLVEDNRRNPGDRSQVSESF